MPKVTVAMPVYNDEKHLREAIDSILQQSFTDFELLIINDGSTDASMNIVKSYTDPRIRIISFAENKGRPFARNTALDNAQGVYLAWMDSDDIATVDRLEKQVLFMDTHPEIDICGAAMEFFNEAHFIARPPVDFQTIQARMLFECCILNPTAFMRRESLATHSLRYRQDMLRVQDYLFWIDAIIGNPLHAANMTDILIKYRYFHRPTSRTYHIKAVRYLLEYLKLPSTEENAIKHTILSLESFHTEDKIPVKEILLWANTLYQALPQQTCLSYTHAVQELHNKVERFLTHVPQPWRYISYYKTLPVGKKCNSAKLFFMLIARLLHTHWKKMRARKSS